MTVSPTALSHRVTVPSVTLSPRAGMVTETDMTLLLCVGVQRLAGQCEMRFAHGFVLGGVGVDQGGDIVWIRLPVHDELAFADLLTDT